MIQTFRRLRARAETPLQRIGLVLLLSPMLLLFGSILHWNLTPRLFFYEHFDYRTQPVPKPPERDGGYWRESDEYFRQGWKFIDRACVEENKSSNNWLLQLEPQSKCSRDFVPHKMRSTSSWRSSIDDYLDELLQGRRGNYYPLNAIGGVMMLIGGFMYFGISDKFFIWVLRGDR